MILFDGTNADTIMQSFTNALGLKVDVFVELLTDYYTFISDNFDDISLETFISFLDENSINVDLEKIYIDIVTLFHKTSVIDRGKSIKSFGLVNLKEIIFGDTPLNSYLQEQGIEFYIKDNVPYINKNGTVSMINRYDMPLLLKQRGENSVRHRLLTDTCLNGYLFLGGALREDDYEHIKYIPEFLYSLDMWIPGIAREWEKQSTPYIIKSEVDIDWLDIKNEYDNSSMINNEKSLYILGKAFEYTLNYVRNGFKGEIGDVPVEYLYLHQSQKIPSENIIQFIEY